MTTTPLTSDPSAVKTTMQQIEDLISQVVFGQRRAIRLTNIAFAVGGHVLIEDVPGTGKTTLARCFAQVYGLSSRRIQGTPDRLPADITGARVPNPQGTAYEVECGPLFAQLVHFDEINRTAPRTQAALLEGMAEGRVTIDNETLDLPRPFLVIATQNPVEMEGTFPLPEAQLDRFLMRIQLGYPSPQEEAELLARWQPPAWVVAAGGQDTPLTQMISPTDLLGLRRLVQKVYVAPEIDTYLISLAWRTRRERRLELGVSPRANLDVRRAAQAFALFEGRAYVRPEDVKAIYAPVIAHRLMLQAQARVGGQSAADLVKELLESEPVPGAPQNVGWGGR